jgi:SAM-dependent methyltransferase
MPGPDVARAGAVDSDTARAFATSWNNLPAGSVYTRTQVEGWLAPLGPADVEARDVLELGCGNGSLLVHVAGWRPRRLVGVDLGASVTSARTNLARTGYRGGEIVQHDLTTYRSPGFDLVYCIGVLHHLKDPEAGLDAVLANLRPGGRFHCWVYGHEGNAVVRWGVEPIRRIASRLPWWVNKYGVATPLAVPFYGYAKTVRALARRHGTAASRLAAALPMSAYSLWVAEREFAFFRHVAFDQLVTPQTRYIRRSEIEAWLRARQPRIDPASIYVIARNGNSWKFGGRLSA